MTLLLYKVGFILIIQENRLAKITHNTGLLIKRRLLFGRKVMTNLDSILKSRDITLPTKVRLVKAIGEGNGTPLQYSGLENPMDRGAW